MPRRAHDDTTRCPAWYFLTFNHITGIPTGSVGGTDIDGTIHTAIGPFGTSQQCETFREAIQRIPGAGLPS